MLIASDYVYLEVYRYKKLANDLKMRIIDYITLKHVKDIKIEGGRIYFYVIKEEALEENSRKSVDKKEVMELTSYKMSDIIKMYL